MKSVLLTMPTYNGERYLPELLDSLVSQTYPFKLYVRDDGSTDATVALLHKYQEMFPEGKELILINDLDGNFQNKGPHENFHFIYEKLPAADYYFFCDQDDVWDSHKIERAVSIMEQYPQDIPLLYTHNYYVCDGELQVQHTLSHRDSISPDEMEKISLPKVIMTGTWAGMGMAQGFNHALRKYAFDAGPLTPSVAVDCWVSWVVAGMNGRLLFDDMPLAHYRRHQGTYSVGNAGGIKRYLDWQKNTNRHCQNIVNGIHDYHTLYGSLVSPKRAYFLELFDGKNRLKKMFYPHRLRKSLLDEIAFRILMAIGKI